jgi:phosphopantothenoylcysteine decarboxylase/phosphopantothenate--cysteine ligase
MRDLSVEIKSDALKNKQIALGICGGIAATETVKIARELRRHGAEVTAFFTKSAELFITPLSLQWATNKDVVTGADANVQHLHKFDLVLIAPATLSTLNKAAAGICDSSVLLLIAAQLGHMGPLLFVPTMNSVLWEHPLLNRNIEVLKSWGCEFFTSPREEDRLKMPPPEAISEKVIGIIK